MESRLPSAIAWLCSPVTFADYTSPAGLYYTSWTSIAILDYTSHAAAKEPILGAMEVATLSKKILGGKNVIVVHCQDGACSPPYPSNPSISLRHCQAILDYTSPASFDYISLAGVVCISASTPSPALFLLLWGHQVWARRSNFLSTSKNQLPFIIPLSSFLRLLLLFIFFK